MALPSGSPNTTLPAGVRLSEFLPNPKGNGAQEWVELFNDADTQADLSGWAIDDAEGGGSPYRLPQGSSIAPHGLLIITLPKALLNNGAIPCDSYAPIAVSPISMPMRRAAPIEASAVPKANGSSATPRRMRQTRHYLPGTPVAAPPMLVTQTLISGSESQLDKQIEPFFARRR